MSEISATYTMELRVIDPKFLIEKAQERAIQEGSDPSLIETLEDALVMLLDPGVVPGCEVDESYAETRGSYAGEEAAEWFLLRGGAP